MEPKLEIIGIPFDRINTIPPAISNDYVMDITANGNTIEREFEMMKYTIQYLLYGDYEASDTAKDKTFPLNNMMYIDVICMRGMFIKTIEAYNLIIKGYESTIDDLNIAGMDRFVSAVNKKIADLNYTVEWLSPILGLMEQWCTYFTQSLHENN